MMTPLLRWVAARKSLVVSATSASVIAVLVATVAIVSGGYTAQRMDLNDGSVWVANGVQRVIGRANTQVLALNTVVPSVGTEIDVVQRGANVLLLDHTDSKVDVVDAATSKILDSVPLPPQNPDVFLAGDSVVVVARTTGQVWVTPLAELAHFDEQAQPTLSLGKNSVVSVSPDGVLFGYSPEARKVYRLSVVEPGSTPETFETGFGNSDNAVTISSVGDHRVLLDATRRVLSLDGRLFDLSSLIGAGGDPVLQQPSSNGEAVLVAFDGGLVSLPVTGGTPRAIVTGQSGFPAPPIYLDGCAYAAWSGGAAWRACGQAAGVLQQLDSVPAAAVRLTFQHNGDRVVLNDPRGGASWAVQDAGQLIDNWDELIVKKEDQQQAEENNTDTPPEVAKDQVPPIAVNDAFGARPGLSSTLPVLLNDYDPNGDVLVISDLTPIDETQGHLDLVNNRQQVQITLSESAHGTFSFRYTIDDGRGGSASATVAVTVRAPSENSAPQQVRQTRMLVAQGGRATSSVLGDWVDPDGDAFYLASAATAPPDTVSYRPEGSVVFVEGGASSEARSVTLSVSDGRAVGAGSIRVTVKKPGDVPIVADPFVVLAYAGQPVTIRPLEHVRGGNGTLRLASVPGKTGATITASLETGSFIFTSDQIRTHYLDFVVNDGDQTATGVIRVDVAAPPEANSKPITIPKTIFVPALGSHTIDVASTDIDPAGGVLLVTGVYNIPGDSGVRAEVLDQRSIRVTLTAPLENGPIHFNYRISNGLAEAEGIVTVIETPRPARLQPPVATDDAVTVRVGDAVNVPVLDNDVQPDGEDLTLNQRLSTTLSGDSGLLFASGDVLRYLAPDKPGNFVATYEVSGPDGQSAQANVRIAVREPNAATNNPPVAATVTARVLAGQSVRIPIPLTGIDPDGDSVQLLGQESNPQKGAVTNVGADYFDYEAGGYSAGTDTFTYTVLDALGARAVGTVRVGISAKLDGARNPIAAPDEVTVRPGGTVSVQVLANDSDPDGSPLSVVSVVPSVPGVSATIAGDLVRVTPPKIPGRYGLIYTIQNGSGGTGSNFITVIVDPNAPPVYPVASDTVLTLTDILGRNTVDVNVLRNVFLADAPVSSLKVSLLPGYDTDAQVTGDKRVRVTIASKSQIIPFSVTSAADASVVAYAFIWVPGYDDALPQINRKARALTVASESALTIDLNNYVVAIGGKKVRLTDSSSVRATHSNGQNLVVDDHTLRFTSADKYFGPASISFQVTDGTSANDPNGRTATLVLPIQVTPRENQPPVFNGGVIDFEPGESKVLDLLKLTTYPYPKDFEELAYTIAGQVPTGFSYTLSGQKLTLRADSDAAKNTQSAIVIGVRDAIAEGEAGTIQLGIVPSTRPLARPAADVAVTPRGRTSVVDVLGNDEATNPFPGQSLSVVAIRGIGGGQLPAGVSIVPSADRSHLAVTVSGNAEPTNVNLQYEVMDATGDPDRYVWGTVTLQIQDVPDPVTSVAVTSFADGSLTVAWSPGGFNNSPITGYEVTTTKADGSVFATTACAVTSGCVVRTPGNGPGNSVRISVTARNSVGLSEPATIGSAVWSDVLPAAPSISDAKATNDAPGAVSISWPALPRPAGGSAITNYIVRIVGADADSSSSVPATDAASYQFMPTLTPGKQYQVTVYAQNSAQVLSAADWRRSAPATVTAVGPPSTAGTVSAVVANQQGDIRVTWGASDPNGAQWVTYSVGRFVAGDTVPTSCQSARPGSDGPVASGWTDSSVADGGNYFYVVYADNGLFCTPTASGSVVTKETPGQANGTVEAAQNGDSGQFDIRASGLDTSNPKFSGMFYQYRVGSGPWTPLPADGWLTSMADSSVYGNAIDVTLRACRDDSGGFCGAPSRVYTVTPVNTRAGVLSCAATQDAVPTVPRNAGNPTVTYQYAFEDPLVPGVWTYSGSAAVPAGATAVRVKATVEIGPAPYYSDPGYAQGACTP